MTSEKPVSNEWYYIAQYGMSDALRMEKAKDLLRRGVDFNEGSEDILGLAVIHGYTSLVRLLIEAGADVNKNATLATAAFYGNMEIIHLLVESGADVNGTTSRGQTPLMQAALQAKTETARFLLDHGANISASSPWGETALNIAKESASPNPKMVSFLEEYISAKAAKEAVTETIRRHHDIAVKNQQSLKSRAPKVVFRGM
jgi:ankyrin repeat protein